jgi:hypothetical protein
MFTRRREGAKMSRGRGALLSALWRRTGNTCCLGVSFPISSSRLRVNHFFESPGPTLAGRSNEFGDGAERFADIEAEQRKNSEEFFLRCYGLICWVYYLSCSMIYVKFSLLFDNSENDARNSEVSGR